MSVLLGVNKLFAIYLGPEQYAVVGQFQNAVQMLATVAGGAMNVGVTKYTAEHYDDETKQRLVWRTAGMISLIASIFTSLIIFYFSEILAVFLFKGIAYRSVFKLLAIVMCFFTLNTLLLAIINGKNDLKSYTYASVSSSLILCLLVILLVENYGLNGALFALAVQQSISFFTTLYVCCRQNWFKIKYLYGKIDQTVALNLGRYTMMGLTSAVCTPVIQILLRNHLGDTLGWSVAGYWEALSRLSSAYLLVVTSTFSLYYLPRLSAIKKNAELKAEIIQSYKTVIPFTATFCFIIYISKDHLIRMLFAPPFAPMSDLIGWQLFGDFLKINSCILSYLMLGKAMFKEYIFTEVLFSSAFAFLSFNLIKQLGSIGVVVAHCITYGLYWIVLYFIVKIKLEKEDI